MLVAQCAPMMFGRLMQAARCDPHLTGSRGLNLNEQPSLHPACYHDPPGRAAGPGRADPAQPSPLELEAWSEPTRRTSRMSRLRVRRMIMMLSPHRAARQLEGTCRGRTSRGRSPRARCPWDPDSRSRPNRETGIPFPFPGQIGNRGKWELDSEISGRTCQCARRAVLCLLCLRACAQMRQRHVQAMPHAQCRRGVSPREKSMTCRNTQRATGRCLMSARR